MDFEQVEKRFLKCGYKYIAGIDEAGRGPLAGPVVAAAVGFAEGKEKWRADIADSKVLSKEARQSLFYKLIGKMDFGIGVVSAQIIDERGILKATNEAMQIAVGNLKIKPDYLLVDGRDHFHFPQNFTSIVKGDNLVWSIAAASIIAKCVRDWLMEAWAKVHPEYKFDQHYGYGTAEHQEILSRLGPCPLHRLTFGAKKEDNGFVESIV